MITDGQIRLAINSKVRCLSIYTKKCYKLSENDALRKVFSSRLYNYYLSDSNTMWYLEPIHTLCHYLDIEYKHGESALDKAIREDYSVC